MENKNQLNCTKLYECMEVKNYKIMCELLNQEVTNGNSKKYQIKNWNRYFDYTKQGQKFIINEIFDKPFPTVDMRAQGSIRKHYKEFQIEYQVYNCSGVYKIQKNNTIYIGSTINFINRFRQHYYNYQDNHIKTQNLLHNGGNFTALWIADKNSVDEEIREQENYYLNLYSSDNQYLMLNDRPSTITKLSLDHLKKTKLLQESYDLRLPKSNMKLINCMIKGNCEIQSFGRDYVYLKMN